MHLVCQLEPIHTYLGSKLGIKKLWLWGGLASVLGTYEINFGTQSFHAHNYSRSILTILILFNRQMAISNQEITAAYKKHIAELRETER